MSNKVKIRSKERNKNKGSTGELYTFFFYTASVLKNMGSQVDFFGLSSVSFLQSQHVGSLRQRLVPFCCPVWWASASLAQVVKVPALHQSMGKAKKSRWSSSWRAHSSNYQIVSVAGNSMSWIGQGTGLDDLVYWFKHGSTSRSVCLNFIRQS